VLFGYVEANLHTGFENKNNTKTTQKQHKNNTKTTQKHLQTTPTNNTYKQHLQTTPTKNNTYKQ
jgi:hypothetical protein